MIQENNWPKFYSEINRLGPVMLTGLDDDWIEFLIESGGQTDDLYSYKLFASYHSNINNPEVVVTKCLKIWVKNAKQYLIDIAPHINSYLTLLSHNEDLASLPPGNSIKLVIKTELISELVAVACAMPLEDDEGGRENSL
jgi:hypothetical protein